jgi:hypothetical protein
MKERWERWWRLHGEGLLTPSELVHSFLDDFDANRVQQELADLPPGFLALVRVFMESERPFKPTGFTLGVSYPTPELQEQVRLHRRRSFQVLADAFGVQVFWSEERGEFL